LQDDSKNDFRLSIKTYLST